MARITLKGDFKFTGKGSFEKTVRKIKVLKQLGNKLFVGGDRETPELIYTIPPGKRVIFAKIDSTGTGLDDWNVAVFLRPDTLPYQELFDYNQQSQKTADTEVVYLAKQEEKTFSLLALGSRTFDDNKLYTGNHSLYQIDIERPTATTVRIKVDDLPEAVFFENDKELSKVEIFDTTNSSQLSQSKKPSYVLNGIISKVSEPESSGKTTSNKFFIDPHHKIKGIYSSKDVENFGNLKLYEVQTFELKEVAEKLPTITYHAPYAKDGIDNQNAKDTIDFFKKCGNPRDVIYALFCEDPGWNIGTGSGISWFRGFPSPCQHAIPPYPTFKATCYIVAELKPPEYIWCPTFVGSGYFTQLKIGGYSFEQTPPFGGQIYAGSNGEIRGKFVPDPSSFNVDTLASGVGGELTVCKGVGWLASQEAVSFFPTEANDYGLKKTGTDYNKTISSAVESKLNSFNSPMVLDMKVVTSSGKIMTSCERPDMGGRNKGENPKYKGGFNEYGFFDSRIEEYFVSRYLVAYFNNPWKVAIIPLTDNKYEKINADTEADLKQNHGLTFGTETGLFYLIRPDQQILKSDIATTKNNITTWKVTELELPFVKSLSLLTKNPSSIPPIKTKVFFEEVLPLKDFDKIWSYSFYN